MTATPLRIAACQITSVADPAVNLAIMESWVRRAADVGARVVVFPEATMAHFGTPLAAVAQAVDGPWATAVAELADVHSVLIATGMFTPTATACETPCCSAGSDTTSDTTRSICTTRSATANRIRSHREPSR
ncbi:putative amidohydrolase [Mycolicibacterium fortuitum]|uniref:Putative amidohydrolase n=1 Tax=Mycolicibacterium fortuitum TaxID=1766 RepID=A0A378U7H6_MYCFO|nr:putative amidohydrolase [Mycolicibacterium fortuitum]